MGDYTSIDMTIILARPMSEIKQKMCQLDKRVFTQADQNELLLALADANYCLAQAQKAHFIITNCTSTDVLANMAMASRHSNIVQELCNRIHAKPQRLTLETFAMMVASDIIRDFRLRVKVTNKCDHFVFVKLDVK